MAGGLGGDVGRRSLCTRRYRPRQLLDGKERGSEQVAEGRPSIEANSKAAARAQLREARNYSRRRLRRGGPDPRSAPSTPAGQPPQLALLILHALQ